MTVSTLNPIAVRQGDERGGGRGGGWERAHHNYIIMYNDVESCWNKYQNWTTHWFEHMLTHWYEHTLTHWVSS